MAFTNNVMIVRHKLLENLVALWKENQLIEKIDRIVFLWNLALVVRRQ